MIVSGIAVAGEKSEWLNDNPCMIKIVTTEKCLDSQCLIKEITKEEVLNKQKTNQQLPKDIPIDDNDSVLEKQIKLAEFCFMQDAATKNYSK